MAVTRCSRASIPRRVLAAGAAACGWALAAEQAPAGGTEGSEDVAEVLQRRERLDELFAGRPLGAWLEPWREKRREWFREIGLNVGVTYDALALAGFGGDGLDTACGGDLTLVGKWSLLGAKLDSPLELCFRLRERDAFGDVAPSELAGQLGALWGVVEGFSDKGFEVPDLYLDQHLPWRGFALRYGQMSIKSLFDKHELRSAKQAFLNRAFSANPAVAFPRFGAGIAATWENDAGFDFALGASSVQGTSSGDQVDFNLGSSDLFEAAQVGRDFAWAGGAPGRLQLMLWQSDAVEDAGLPSGSGASLVLERGFPGCDAKGFARLAWSNDGAADVDRLIAAGAAFHRGDSDLLGVAAGIGRGTGDDHDWQAVLECFWRWQPAPYFHLTPDLQLLGGSGFEGGGSLRLVAGLRGSLAF